MFTGGLVKLVVNSYNKQLESKDKLLESNIKSFEVINDSNGKCIERQQREIDEKNETIQTLRSRILELEANPA